MSANTDARRTKKTRRGLLVVLIILILLLSASTVFLVSLVKPIGKVADAKSTGGMVWVRSIYGYGDSHNEQIQDPNDVAVAGDGTIWATDQTRARILGFNPDGTFVRALQPAERGKPGAFQFPSSVAVGDDGLIYVGDSIANKVTVMSPDNEVVRTIDVPGPLDVAARGDRIVVGSVAGFAIYDKEGQVIKVLGSRGKGKDQFDAVRGVAIDAAGTIFAIDQYNNRVSAYDKNGARKWLLETGAAGNSKPVAMKQAKTKARARMSLPAHLTIDGAGRLVVADPFDFSLTVLDSKNGNLIAKYGKTGTADGEFTYPNAVDYDAGRDWFVVADTANSRLQIVRIPDSGGSALSPMARTLTGPIRALFLPLLLLLLALIVWIVVRRRDRKRKGNASAPSAPRPAVA